MHDTKARPRVLFVSHSASRNGASLLLLTFMQWLRQRDDWEMDLVVHGGGPLLPQFAAVADRTTVWRDPAARLDALLRRKGGALRRFVEDAWPCAASRPPLRPDLRQHRRGTAVRAIAGPHGLPHSLAYPRVEYAIRALSSETEWRTVGGAATRSSPSRRQ